jgi:hypothetical protein
MLDRMNETAPNNARPRLLGQGTNREFYLPRLPREYYQGDAVVHWTLPMALRATGWLDELFHARFREIMLHAAAREGLFCPTYCLMPDHLHLVWMGLRRDSDQRNGMKFLRDHLGRALRPRRFQHQAHDHVLREEERQRRAFAKVCFYVIDNARVAGLVKPVRGTGRLPEPSCRAIRRCIRWPRISGRCFGSFISRPARRMRGISNGPGWE